MIGLDQTATVYTRAVDGTFTTTAQTGLACRVCHLAAGSQATSDEREEQAARRMLLFDPTYTMPDYAQVLVGTERYNVVEGTAVAPRGPFGSVVFRRVDLVRAN